jgi:hypothetical protein
MGMTKIYGYRGVFRKLFALTVLFPLIKRYGSPQLGFKFLEPLLNLPARRPRQNTAEVLRGNVPQMRRSA